MKTEETINAYSWRRRATGRKKNVLSIYKVYPNSPKNKGRGPYCMDVHFWNNAEKKTAQAVLEKRGFVPLSSVET